MSLHEDEGNKSATVVLIFGTDLEGFDQIYPTAGVRIACGCWAFACADARELLHAVAHFVHFRKLALVCIPSLFWESPGLQVMYGILTTFGTFVLYAYLCPYDEGSDDGGVAGR